MPRDPVYPDEVFVEALATTMGNVCAAAKIIGCHRKTVASWLDRNPHRVRWRNVIEERGEELAIRNICEGLTAPSLETRLETSKWYLRNKCGWHAQVAQRVEVTVFADELRAQLRAVEDRERGDGHDVIEAEATPLHG